MIDNPDDICAMKVAFDTEFEAQRKAAITGHKWGEEMYAYKCLNFQHWHIAHVKHHLRNKHKNWCDACQQVVKRHQRRKHALKKAHIENVEKQKGAQQ